MLFSVNKISKAINVKTEILKYLAKILKLSFFENFLKIKSENKIITKKTRNVIEIKRVPKIKIWVFNENSSENKKFGKNNAKNKKIFGFNKFINIPFFRFLKILFDLPIFSNLFLE